MPFDVFLCHSSSDSQVANEMCVVLEREGFRCWIAPRDVVPGQEWAEAIVQGIDDAQVLVLILSSPANASRQVLREVERAVRSGSEIITFRIEDITPSPSLDYYLAVHQWIDAFEGPLSHHLSRLPAQLGQLIRPREQGESSLRSRSNVVELLVSYPGVRGVLMDIQGVIRLDGPVVKEGSLKHGFEFTFRTTTGVHELMAKIPFRLAKRYPLPLPEPGRYRVELQYSRMWGNFSGRCALFDNRSGPTYVHAYFLNGNKALQSLTTIVGFFVLLFLSMYLLRWVISFLTSG